MLHAVAALAVSALLSGPGPVVDLGASSATATDYTRYVATVRGDALRIYDAQTRRRARTGLDSNCHRLASRAGGGRFLIACDTTRAIVVDARTRRRRTVHALRIPEHVLGMHWLGVGRRNAVYQWEYDDCDSL